MSKSTASRPPRKNNPPPAAKSAPLAEADPQQLLHDVAEWWAKALGMLEAIKSTASAIAAEASDPDSPLHTATSADHWLRFAGMLQDSNAINCSITFSPGLPDPLRSLAAKGGA